jgi:hypothetical protein
VAEVTHVLFVNAGILGMRGFGYRPKAVFIGDAFAEGSEMWRSIAPRPSGVVRDESSGLVRDESL